VPVGSEPSAGPPAFSYRPGGNDPSFELVWESWVFSKNGSELSFGRIAPRANARGNAPQDSQPSKSNSIGSIVVAEGEITLQIRERLAVDFRVGIDEIVQWIAGLRWIEAYVTAE